MGLRVNKVARRQVKVLQAQLYAAREQAGLSAAVFSGVLGINSKTLRKWEKGHSSPGLTFMLRWTRELGLRLVITDRLTQEDLTPLRPEDSIPWEEQEVRRLAAPLKSRRLDRGLSQTELGLCVGVSRSSLQRWEDADQLPRIIALAVVVDRLDCVLGLEECLLENGSALVAVTGLEPARRGL
jgi:DNA-binding transcriptional regulator YiaG